MKPKKLNPKQLWMQFEDVIAPRLGLSVKERVIHKIKLEPGLRRVELWSGEIQEHHVGALLRAFEDDFTAVRGDVEVANVEARREVGQLTLRAAS